jgi:phosphoribosylpyrophosphate synthetase
MIDDISVPQGAHAHGRDARARRSCACAGPRHRRRDPDPDTSRDSALEIANVLGVKYREGFIKNRYVGRTFIMPGQGERVKSVKRKLNPIPLEFRGRNVLLVDDSIVRGTDVAPDRQMARDAGRKKVYLALRRAAGALPEHLRHRHAVVGRTRRA